MASEHQRNTATVLGAVRREETTLRLGGVGDNWHMSWAADDRQFVSLCDGFGWGQTEVFHNSRMLAISGLPADARFEDLPGYPDLAYDLSDPASWSRYYAFGTLALDGSVYQFLSTPNRGFDLAEPRFAGVKLIHSPDDGRTWCNQDGSTPVVWEPWDERTPQNMVFFEEPDEAFSLLTVLQMGRNYEDNEDGYVYVYSPNGNTEGTMNQLVMFRVPKGRILDRSAYEFFAGRDAAGEPKWTAEIEGRGVVHTFPAGWVNTKVHPYAWHPSIVYVKALNTYLMANWGMGCTTDGEWFGKPSYLGFWTAPDPWGPWTQIYEDEAWTPDGDPAARAYQPQIAPKWIAPDGRSFWLVWTDYQEDPDGTPKDTEVWKEVIEKGGTVPFRELEWVGENMPYYAFNVQRVDLLL
jgi:hypothetical protein